MALSSSSSSSFCNWSYDVFPSFSGEDVRKTFLSHFLKQLDGKLIISFKDNEIERSRSLGPELKQAIRDSRIAVVVFSELYASSTWCLNELLEIVKCKKDFGQLVIPIFYHLDPSHVRKQTGEFGKIFDKTCGVKTEDEKTPWRGALTDVANILGYHIVNGTDEASMIENIANDVLGKLHLSPSDDDFDEFVGIEDHIKKMSSLLSLESEEVRMVGLWGPSGIGKTIIARALFSRLSRNFQNKIFIDRFFISRSKERADLVDYNMKLHLQRSLLAELLGKKDINIDNIRAIEKMLKHRKVLIVIDDLDDQDVLDAIAGRGQWFGNGSRIIVVTKDKHLLRAHGIKKIYEVCLPSKDLALEMFCRSAFRKNSPPRGFWGLACDVVFCAGNLPLGLNVFGSSLRDRDKEDWTDMLARLQNGLDGKIEKTLRVSYDRLNNKKDKAIFRYIACLFNGEQVDDIKLLLADSNLNVNIGLKNLLDKSLIHQRHLTVEMHSLLQELGKEIVRTQSDEPGEREFLLDSKDICHVLRNNTGTKKILGIALNIDETEELDIHESAFKAMSNLLFLKISTKKLYMKREWHLPKSFDYFPPKLRLLCWNNYPRRFLPTNFHPENLVKIQMQESKLEKLWDGAHSLTALKNMDLWGSKSLKEIPDLSKATSLETLNLRYCSSLVELPSSIQNLNKLSELDMSFCISLKTLPTRINLKSLEYVNFDGCILLKSFPDISTNISKLYLNQTGIEEVPWWIENFSHLRSLKMRGCYNLRRLSLHMTKLKYLYKPKFSDCGALTESSWNDSSSEVTMSTDDIEPTCLFDDPSCPLDGYFRVLNLSFIDSTHFDPEALIRQQSVFMELLLLGEQVPSYFTHRTTGTSLTNIPLPHFSTSQLVVSFRCCVVVDANGPASFKIESCFKFKDKLGNHRESISLVRKFSTKKLGTYQVIFDCYFPLLEEFAALADQLKYGHMDVQFRLVKEDPMFPFDTEDPQPQLQLKGCGIQFPDRKGPCSPNSKALQWAAVSVVFKLVVLFIIFVSFSYYGFFFVLGPYNYYF